MKQKLKLTFLTLWGMLFLCGTPSLHAQTTSISGSSISIVGDDYDDRSSRGSLRVDLPSSIQPGDVSFLFLGQMVPQLERGLYLVKLGNHAGSENVRLTVQ